MRGGNTKGINAQFNINKEQLAFAMDPSADDLFTKLYLRHRTSVVNRLKMYGTRSELWLDLHQSL